MLAEIIAFLAPEPVSLTWFTNGASRLPEPLADCAGDPLALRRLLVRLSDSALVQVGQDRAQMHRLTQAILRDRLKPDQRTAAGALAAAVLAANQPDATTIVSWPQWAQLLHVEAISPASMTSAVCGLACEAARYLLKRGDFRAAQDLARQLHQELGAAARSGRSQHLGCCYPPGHCAPAQRTVPGS